MNTKKMMKKSYEPHESNSVPSSPEFKREAKKPERIPLNARGAKLAVAKRYKREGYQLYWAVDRPGEIESFEEAGFSVVKDKNGQTVRIHAGRGEYHVLVETTQEIWDEEKGAAQDRVIEIHGEHMKVDKAAGEYTSNKNGMAVQRDII